MTPQILLVTAGLSAVLTHQQHVQVVAVAAEMDQL